MRKNIIILTIILVICLIGLGIYDNLKVKLYEKELLYMDTNISVKIYSDNSKKANNALKEIDEIYSEYHKLTDRYNSYSNIINLYTINNNVLDDKYLKIDEKLYKLIEYGIKLYNESNGKIDISMGNIIDVWKGYRESGIGVPTLEELKYVDYNNINKIELKDGKIKNNNLNLDLGSIAKGYVTEEVGKYLDSIGIDKYLINAGGNALVGNYYKKGKYKVGLEDPNSNTGDIFKIINVTNKAIVTSGGYLRYYEYKGKKYHHIIDPDTLFPTDYMKSVTIITDSSAYADFLSTYIFLLPVEEGKKYIESLDNVEAIWYLNDDTYVTSSGFNKYE